MRKFFKLFIGYVYSLAINSANMVSIRGIYQPKEPEILKKYLK